MTSDTQISFDLSAEAMERIDRMMMRTRKRLIGQLLMEALRYYEWVLEEREAGNVVGSLDHERHFAAIKE